MAELVSFIEKMKEKYGDKVVANERIDECSELEKVPQPLREFYSLYENAEFPFGEIDAVSVAVNHSEIAEPFKSEGWFCFGFDGYFSYWLCRREPDEEGLWIVDWDHDTDDEIEGVYTTLVEFLEKMEEEYEPIEL